MAVDDVNGDGWLDLYVCFSAYQTPARRKNKLFINNRYGTFTVVSEAAGISGEGYGLGVVVTDINRYTLFCGEQISLGGLLLNSAQNQESLITLPIALSYQLCLSSARR